MSDLQAGRELDALVAEQVMGCSVERRSRPVFGASCRCVGEIHWQSDMSAGVPNYSTDIAAAWQVVEHMQRQGWGMAHIMFWQFSSVARGHNVQFYRAVYPPQYGEGPWEEGDKGRSFPLAVCRAALAAIERDTGRGRAPDKQTTSPGGASRVVQP